MAELRTQKAALGRPSQAFINPTSKLGPRPGLGPSSRLGTGRRRPRGTALLNVVQVRRHRARTARRAIGVAVNAKKTSISISIFPIHQFVEDRAVGDQLVEVVVGAQVPGQNSGAQVLESLHHQVCVVLESLLACPYLRRET